MTAKRVKRRWRICWKFISPLIILGVIIGGLVQMIRDMADGKYTYTAWDRNKVISLKKLIIELRVLCILSAGVNTICLPVFKRLQEAAKYKAIIFPPHVRSSSPQHPHRCSQGVPHFSCMERDNMKQLYVVHRTEKRPETARAFNVTVSYFHLKNHSREEYVSF